MTHTRRLFLSLLPLAALVGFPVAASAADCAPASQAFMTWAHEANMLIDAVVGHRVDWEHLSVAGQAERDTYAKVNDALQALLPAMKDFLGKSQAALGPACQP